MSELVLEKESVASLPRVLASPVPATIFFLSIFLLFFMRVVLTDDIEVAVLWLERTLGHVGNIRRSLTVVRPTSLLFDLVLGDLKDSEILGQVFHGEGVLRRKVLHLLHGKEAGVELS